MKLAALLALVTAEFDQVFKVFVHNKKANTVETVIVGEAENLLSILGGFSPATPPAPPAPAPSAPAA